MSNKIVINTNVEILWDQTEEHNGIDHTQHVLDKVGRLNGTYTLASSKFTGVDFDNLIKYTGILKNTNAAYEKVPDCFLAGYTSEGTVGGYQLGYIVVLKYTKSVGDSERTVRLKVGGASMAFMQPGEMVAIPIALLLKLEDITLTTSSPFYDEGVEEAHVELYFASRFIF